MRKRINLLYEPMLQVKRSPPKAGLGTLQRPLASDCGKQGAGNPRRPKIIVTQAEGPDEVNWKKEQDKRKLQPRGRSASSPSSSDTAHESVMVFVGSVRALDAQNSTAVLYPFAHQVSAGTDVSLHSF